MTQAEDKPRKVREHPSLFLGYRRGTQTQTGRVPGFGSWLYYFGFRTELSTERLTVLRWVD
jgi:hypothetical protein